MAAPLLELLQWNPSTPSVDNEAGYVRLHNRTASDVAVADAWPGDQEEDLRHLLPPYTPMHVNAYQAERKASQAAALQAAAGPGLCLQSCFVLSLGGLVFLTIIGSLLARNTPFIILPAGVKGDSLSGSLYGGAAMYLVVMCYCGFLLIKARCRRPPRLFDT